jgi:hypothetical protein
MRVIVVFKEKVVLAVKLVLIWHLKSGVGRFIIKKINTIEKKKKKKAVKWLNHLLAYGGHLSTH